jgi:hypothetical protein
MTDNAGRALSIAPVICSVVTGLSRMKRGAPAPIAETQPGRLLAIIPGHHPPEGRRSAAAPRSHQPSPEVSRNAHELRSGVSEPPQHVESHGIDGKQIGQIDADRAGEGRTDATQFVDLREVQAPRKVDSVSVVLVHDVDATLHGK